MAASPCTTTDGGSGFADQVVPSSPSIAGMSREQTTCSLLITHHLQRFQRLYEFLLHFAKPTFYVG
jgi:hypothetical protein